MPFAQSSGPRRSSRAAPCGRSGYTPTPRRTSQNHRQTGFQWRCTRVAWCRSSAPTMSGDRCSRRMRRGRRCGVRAASRFAACGSPPAPRSLRGFPASGSRAKTTCNRTGRGNTVRPRGGIRKAIRWGRSMGLVSGAGRWGWSVGLVDGADAYGQAHHAPDILLDQTGECPICAALGRGIPRRCYLRWLRSACAARCGRGEDGVRAGVGVYPDLRHEMPQSGPTRPLHLALTRLTQSPYPAASKKDAPP